MTNNILNKPYTDIEYADFICAHQGLNRYEDENCVIMYTDSEKVVNGEVVDRTQDADYIAEQKAKLIQSEEVKKAAIFSKVADSILTDDLQLKVGKITQAVHDSRLTAKLAIYKQAEDNFYTNTGLERPATIGA